MATTAPDRAARALSVTDEVTLAMLPGLFALLAWFGWGTPVNVLLAIPAALGADALLRGGLPLSRGSLPGALVVAIALPPAAPWWLVIGTALGASAIRFPIRQRWIPALNPAMIVLAVALLLFPDASTRWLAPSGAAPLPAQPLALTDALRASFGSMPATQLDGITMATPLAVLREDTSRTIAELRAMHAQFGTLGGRGWEWAGAGFLLGGAWLAWRGLLAWRPAAGMLAALWLAAALTDDGSSASTGPPLLHLFSGGTLFAACFVLTEPQGLPRSPRWQLLIGALAGILVFLLRAHGTHADGIAFAVVAVNALPALLPAAAGPAERSRWKPLSRRIAAAAALGLVYCAWHGSAGVNAARSDDPATRIALVLGESPPMPPEAFGIRDDGLLGYPDARTAWRIRDRSGTIAVVLPARAPDGYAGPIDLLVGVRRDGTLTGVQVLAHTETPGIGDAIATLGWIERFRGQATAPPDGISGATVSSRAVSRAVARVLRHFEINRARLLGDDGPTDPMSGEPPG